MYAHINPFTYPPPFHPYVSISVQLISSSDRAVEKPTGKKKEENETNKQTKTGLSSHGPVLVHERVELDVLWRQAGQQGVEDAEGVGSSPTVHQEPLVQAKHPKVR